MSDEAKAPIIVKKKKVIAGGHHGGAWKVAYADFVTAMMAFFLLMWLLGATNEKQRKGIADYFNPTIPINKVSGGGSGAFGGDSLMAESTLAKNGTGASAAHSTENQASRGSSGMDSADAAEEKAKEQDELAELAAKLAGKGGESFVSDLLARHIITRLSDEGLIVEVFDLPDAPLFTGAAEPTEDLKKITRSVYEVFRLSNNPVAVQAHTASVPVVSVERPGWDQSADRANAVRRLLKEAGLSETRAARITGFSDREPAVRDLLSIRNNRVEIILLRQKL